MTDPKIWKQAHTLRSYELIFLLYINAHHGTLQQKYLDIQHATGLSARSLSFAIHGLEDDGLIEVERWDIINIYSLTQHVM